MLIKNRNEAQAQSDIPDYAKNHSNYQILLKRDSGISIFYEFLMNKAHLRIMKMTGDYGSFSSLDYSRVEIAVDARRGGRSCGHPPQVRHNEADAVRSARPKGKKRR